MKYLNNKPFPTGLYEQTLKDFLENILKNKSNENLPSKK